MPPIPVFGAGWLNSWIFCVVYNSKVMERNKSSYSLIDLSDENEADITVFPGSH
jgi:hypothetical protein